MRNVLKVGIPGRLDIEWQRGSDGNITCVAPESVDLTGVTSVTTLVKANPGNANSRTILTPIADLTQKASRVIILTLTEEASLAPAGGYGWYMQLNGGPLDSRIVFHGSWKHSEPIPGEFFS